MKRILLLFIILILGSVPVFSAEQDDDASSGDFSGGNTAEMFSSGPKSDPLIEIRNWLGRSGAPPLEKNQQKLLRKVYDDEVKALAKPFEKQFGVSLQAALKTQPAQSGRRTGGGRANRELTAEVHRISSHLSDKLFAALPMEQQLPVRKFQSEMVRQRRVDRFKQTTEASGLSLTEQQESDIDAIFARESYLRTQAIIQANGESYEKSLSFVASQTEKRIALVLDPSQPNALSAENAPAGSPQPSPEETQPHVD